MIQYVFKNRIKFYCVISFKSIQQNVNRNTDKGKITSEKRKLLPAIVQSWVGIQPIYTNNFITPRKCLEKVGRGEKWLSAGACYCVINFIHLLIYCFAVPTVVRFNEGSMRLEVLLTENEGGLPRGWKRSGGKMIGRMKNGSAIIGIEESQERPQQRLNLKKRRRGRRN